MLIRLSKPANGASPTLTCIRGDGSVTWQRSSPYFAFHDLLHYAIETTLGYRCAFFGLVAAGRDLDQFGTRSGMKDTYTCKAGWAELIAAHLWMPQAREMGDAELQNELLRTCAARMEESPTVSEAQIGAIRRRSAELHALWNEMPDGDALELTF